MHVHDKYQNMDKYGKIDPYLFCEHDDQFFCWFYRYFSKQYLVGNIQKKFEKTLSTTFVSVESP